MIFFKNLTSLSNQLKGRGSRNCPKEKQKGLSLIEILIYIAIFGTVAAGLVGVVWNITRIHTQQIAANEVDENLRYVMNLINAKVREATIIESASGSTLVLKMPDSNKSPTTFSLTNGVLYMQEGNQDPVAITSNRVNVDSLTFEKISMAGAKGGVKINITLSYKTEGRPELAFSKNYLSTVSKVSAITFDSDLLPDVNNLRNIGADSPRWKHGYFSGNINASGDITAGGYVKGITGLCMGSDCRTSWGQVSGVTGSGTSGYLAKWTGTSSIGDSVIYESSTGNIGIGLTNPNARLHVNSVLPATGTAYGIYINTTDSATDTLTNVTREGLRVVYTKSGSGTISSYMSLTGGFTGFLNSGSVTNHIGIWSRQQISGATVTNLYDFYADAQYGSTGNVGTRYGLRVFDFNKGSSQSLTNQYGVYINSLTSGTNNYAIYTAGTTPSYFGGNVYFDGNVGIGTTSPASKLHILHSTTGGDGIVTEIDGGYPYIIQKTFSDTNWHSLFINSYRARNNRSSPTAVAAGDRILSLIGSPYNGSTYSESVGIYFYVDGTPTTHVPTQINFAVKNTSGDYNTAMVIKSSGNVGIGTTSPGAKLHVSGYALVGGQNAVAAFDSGSASVETGLTLLSAGTKQWHIASRNTFDTPNNRLGFYDNSNTERLTILQGGNVGIGTTSPNYKLDVNGTANISGNFYFGDFTSVYRDSTSQSIPHASWTVVQFNAIESGSNYSTSNYRYTVPKSGRYLIIASLHYEYYLGWRRILVGVRKNGTGTIWTMGYEWTPNIGINTNVFGSRILQANQGDYFEIMTYQQNEGSNSNNLLPSLENSWAQFIYLGS